MAKIKKPKPWQTMFDIEEERTTTGIFGVNVRFYVVDKTTRERLFTEARPYGYSGRRDACRGAAQRYNAYHKILERTLLGG